MACQRETRGNRGSQRSRPASLETWGAQIPRAQHLGLNKPRAETRVHVRGSRVGSPGWRSLSPLPEGPQPSPLVTSQALLHPQTSLLRPTLLCSFHFFPLTVLLMRKILVSGRGPELSTEVTERTSYAPRGLTFWRWLTNMQIEPPRGLQRVSAAPSGCRPAPIACDFLRAGSCGTVGSRSQSSDCLESRPLSSEESCTDTCLFSVAVFSE